MKYETFLSFWFRYLVIGENINMEIIVAFINDIERIHWLDTWHEVFDFLLDAWNESMDIWKKRNEKKNIEKVLYIIYVAYT